MSKPRSVQITFDLFTDLISYAARHQEPDDLQYKRICFEAKSKLEAMMKHEYYTIYKSGDTREKRSEARSYYLEMAGILKDFIWPDEYDVNVTRSLDAPFL